MPSAFRALIAIAVVMTVSQSTLRPLYAQLEVAANDTGDINQTIEVAATYAETWRDGDTTVTSLMGGGAEQRLAGIRQGELELLAEKIVIVDTIAADGRGHDVQVYATNNVSFKSYGRENSYAMHTIRLQSIDTIKVLGEPATSELKTPSHLMASALNKLDPTRSPGVTQVAAQVDNEPFTPPQFLAIPNAVTPLSRRIQIRPRSSTPLRFESGPARDTEPREQVYVITGGVNVLVEGVQPDIGGRVLETGVLDLSADRVVVWMHGDDAQDLQLNPTLEQSSAARFQVYLEGNILVRQGNNKVTASHAFVDVSNDRALLMNAELRAYLPQTGGEVRVRAEKLRQMSANRFHAQDGSVTTSPYGKPGYRIQASDIVVEPGPISPFTPLDPYTGQPIGGPPLWVTATNSQFVIGDIPVLTLPRISAPAEDPHIPIRRAVVKHDRIFGLQIKTVWDLSKVLGVDSPRGMQWDLLGDYRSKRGPSVGIEGEYDVRNAPGRMLGEASVIYQYDKGADNLGLDRNAVAPEDYHRGQAIWRHRQELPGRAMIFGEIGYISDRNYRESFHESDYDRDKDAETLIGARQDAEEWSLSILGKTELNEFESSTDWLPKADLFGFSQPLFNGLAYLSSHSSVGYADLEPGKLPPNTATDPFSRFGTPYYQDRSGLVAMTRHQIDAPFMLGVVNIRPYAMGEAAFWDEGLQENDIDRFLFNGGVEAHLAATKVMPFVRNDLWNLNGLVHKSDLFLNYSYTDVSRNLNEVAQFNQIDDNTTERFRGRYTDQIFPGFIPNEFDPRNYAIRTGAGLWVSAPYHELAEDQEVIRLRWRNRLQTKVGPAGNRRIRDWMIWETGVSYFPDADRDNFGENFGLIYGNYRFNVNDRTSLLADGIVDLFENSQDVWSVGVLSQRSTRGSVYLGYRKVEAKNYVDSQTLVASYSYQMSPKWIGTGAISYDVAAGESRGSSLTFSRVGLDWILHVGFGIDTSKDNVGVAFSVEPRFGPPSPTNLSYLLGLQ